MVTYDALTKAVIEGDKNVVESEVNKALGEGAEARSILTEGLIGGMSVVGERFRAGDMFLPEVLMSASAMHKGLDIVKPLLAKSGQRAVGRVVIGTVAGDIHDIGKRIVGFLLEGHGFEVIDLGVNVPNESLVQAVEEYNPDILGMSALLTTTMPNMGVVIDLLKEKGIRDNVRIIVGGASVNQEFADSIGADGYAPEAGSAMEWVKKTIAKS
jgi:5-methyltetrahydrofolate--homocysteine methyltransferase